MTLLKCKKTVSSVCRLVVQIVKTMAIGLSSDRMSLPPTQRPTNGERSEGDSQDGFTSNCGAGSENVTVL